MSNLNDPPVLTDFQFLSVLNKPNHALFTVQEFEQDRFRIQKCTCLQESSDQRSFYFLISDEIARTYLNENKTFKILCSCGGMACGGDYANCDWVS